MEQEYYKKQLKNGWYLSIYNEEGCKMNIQDVDNEVLIEMTNELAQIIDDFGLSSIQSSNFIDFSYDCYYIGDVDFVFREKLINITLKK